MKNRYLLIVVLLLPVHCAFAEKAHQTGTRWTGTLKAGTVYQSSASLDQGGDMSAGRFYLQGSTARTWGNRWRIGAAIGYGEDRYDFSGSSGFGGLDPWDRIQEFRISTPVQYFASESWTIYAIPSLRFNAETSASFSDGKSGGLLTGAAYRVSDSLTIGPGLGVFSEIENSTSFFPVLILDWKVTNSLSVETGRGFAASRGPGLQLRWQYSPRWQFFFGGRYEKIRFRLDDKGIAPDGVGQEKSIPLFAMAQYALTQDVEISLIGGAEVGGNLRLENNEGNLISESDISTAPFFGATLNIRM